MGGRGLLHADYGESMESMKYQGTQFFDDLVEVIGSARNNKVSNSSVKDLGESITKITKKHTGINADCIIEHASYINACAYIMPVHVEMFFNEYVQPVLKKEAKDSKAPARSIIYGSVDTKTGKVGGIFSKLQTKMVYSTEIVYGDFLTVEEVATVFLHEIGHLYTTLLLATRYMHGMAALTDVVRQFEGSSDYGKREAILIRKAKEMGGDVDKKDIEAAFKADSSAKDGSFPGTASLMIRMVQDDVDIYAGRALEYQGRVLEQMADEFAQKHGAGVYGAAAIAKLSDFNPAQKKGAIGTVARSGTLLALLSAAALALTVPGFGPTAAIVGIVYFANGVIEAWLGSNAYDTGRARIAKMADQIAVRAKDTGVPKEMAKDMVVEYKKIREIESKLVDEPNWLPGIVTALVPPFKRRARFTAAMVEIERLASNELYIQSQQLKHV